MVSHPHHHPIHHITSPSLETTRPKGVFFSSLIIWYVIWYDMVWYGMLCIHTPTPSYLLHHHHHYIPKEQQHDRRECSSSSLLLVWYDMVCVLNTTPSHLLLVWYVMSYGMIWYVEYVVLHSLPSMLPNIVCVSDMVWYDVLCIHSIHLLTHPM